MKVLVSGSSGLIGSALVTFLAKNQVEVTRLVRRQDVSGASIIWDPYSGYLDIESLEGFDAVVHLSGESVANKRWSEEQKKLIRASRVLGTTLLSEQLAKLKNKPKVLVSASAIGFYGNRGDETLNEESTVGKGFLADLAYGWESATRSAQEAGITTTQMRIGIVLATTGGALSRLLPIFKMGAGGPIDSGKQYMSWIAIDDVVGAIWHAISKGNLAGPVNATAPNPVTNADFTKTLAGVLHRPAFLPVPAFALRAAMGQMADELLLASCRVQPAILIKSGYQFKYPNLKQALEHIIG